jgi:hypothetical protein
MSDDEVDQGQRAENGRRSVCILFEATANLNPTENTHTHMRQYTRWIPCAHDSFKSEAVSASTS